MNLCKTQTEMTYAEMMEYATKLYQQMEQLAEKTEVKYYQNTKQNS